MFPPPGEKLRRDICGCGGGLHAASVNELELLEIYYCCFARAADARSVCDS